MSRNIRPIGLQEASIGVSTNDNNTELKGEDKAEVPTSKDVGDRDKVEDLSPRTLHGIKWGVTVAAVLSTVFLFALDTTIVADVQPGLVEALGEVEKLAWVGAAFALGAAATILQWSKAYGVLNIKWLYISHVLLFEIGSAICGAAPTMNALIVGRAIAGFGASGMYSGCLTYLSVLTSEKERPMYLSLVGLAWGTGTILGPPIGGGFVDSSATWRWAFYINLVVGGLFSPVYLVFLPSVAPMKDVPLSELLQRQFDWLGIIIFAVVMICLTMAVTFGGSFYPWGSGSEIALWIVGGVMLLAFVVSQWFHPFVLKKHKLYPTHLYRNFVILGLQITTIMVAISLLVPVFYLPLYFQFTRGETATAAAVHLLPLIIMVVVFTMLNGALMPRIGYYMPWYVVGGALVLTGSALMFTVIPTTSDARIHGYNVLIGVGVGCFLQAGISVAQLLVSPKEVTDVVGLMTIGQSGGIVVGLAIAGAVFQNEAIRRVQAIFPDIDPESLRGFITGNNGQAFQALSQSDRSLVLLAITGALGSVYIITMISGGLVFVIGCVLPRTKLFVE